MATTLQMNIKQKYRKTITNPRTSTNYNKQWATTEGAKTIGHSNNIWHKDPIGPAQQKAYRQGMPPYARQTFSSPLKTNTTHKSLKYCTYTSKFLYLNQKRVQIQNYRIIHQVNTHFSH